MPILTEQQFALVSDVYGVAENVPKLKLSSAFSPDSSGIFLQYGLVRTMPGGNPTFLDGDEAKVQTPDGNPIIHFHTHTSAAGTEYVFVYTKAHVYLWDDVDGEYDTMHTCASDCTIWSTASFNGHLISTNNVDKVQDWDETTPATVFAPLDSASGIDYGGGNYITKAKYVAVCENYLWLFGTTEGGTSYPRRGRWSSYGDYTDFDETGSGDTGSKDFHEGSDVIKGAGKYTYGGADMLVVFKEKSTYLVWLVEIDDVWNITRAEGEVGLLATHGLVNDKDGHLYYIASDYTIRKLHHGAISQAIDKTVKNISATYQDYIEATYIDQYNQLWFSIPSQAGSTGNDKTIAYNLEYGIWHPYPFSMRAFGQ